MVSKSTGRSNSVQQTRLANKTNQINFNLAFKVRSNFQTIFRQIFEAPIWELSNEITLANQTLRSEQFRTDRNLHFAYGHLDSR